MIRKGAILYSLRRQNQGQLAVFGANCQEKHSNYRCSAKTNKHKRAASESYVFLLTLTLQIQVGQSLDEEEEEEGTRDSYLKVASSPVADHIAFS